MRAKASIPAWGRVALACLGAIMVVALITAPAWRPRIDTCASLRDNVEAVRSASVTHRVSDTWIRHERREKYGWSQSRFVEERGDFHEYLTQYAVRTCLGGEWTEGHSYPQRSWVREEWTYSRVGWPEVHYRVGIDGGQRVQIVVGEEA